MAGAEETPNVEKELKDNQQLQQAEEIEEKKAIEEKSSLETAYEEQEQPEDNEESEEEEPTEGIPIPPGLPLEKITLRAFIDLDHDYYSVSDVSEKDSGSSSDLGLGSLDLELRAFFSEWLKAKISC